MTARTASLWGSVDSNTAGDKSRLRKRAARGIVSISAAARGRAAEGNGNKGERRRTDKNAGKLSGCF